MTDAEARILHPEFYGKHYIFFRKGMFYHIELGNDDQARANAECNPGTIRVEGTDGKTVWPVRH